ncbi:MAG: aminotransferase class I/II-fold pyridoxal phosphate-dependent enzyme, partial [Spirochaetota bacterium]|nr:aminotransferase class I/II-fold pyridoxal phosphate-dependent enzyme [Spirochaetota bacterium]
LEEELALFKGKEACLLFGSGYLANLSLLSTLPTSHDLVLSDELNHASIIDGCKLSRAKIVSYPHNNMNWLNDFLESNRGKYTNVFIVSDAIFSMDGDIISLRDLYEISNIFETIPILDEAHSTGVIGLNGRGIESYYNIENPNSIIMGTLGKALGSYGAFVCGKKELIDFLINKSRTFIFTTALPPAPVISATVALELIKKNAQIHFQLRENVKYFVNCLLQSGIEVFSKSAIIPIIIGKADITMSISDDLLRNGVYMQGIRPPTVSKDASRIRITMSSTHTEKQLNNALNILVDTLKKYGII